MRRPTFLLAIVLLLLLGAMAFTPLLQQPPALRTDNKASQFDAIGAKARLATILGDQRPHSADSAADDGVRSRLVASLQQLGLRPIVRDQFACNELFKQRGVACARVRNVIAVLGPAPERRCCSTLTMTAFLSGLEPPTTGSASPPSWKLGRSSRISRLERPVILLFNEGEELGLVGARAFLADPLSRMSTA